MRTGDLDDACRAAKSLLPGHDGAGVAAFAGNLASPELGGTSSKSVTADQRASALVASLGSIQIALRRRVYIRLGARLLPIIAFGADVEAF